MSNLLTGNTMGQAYRGTAANQPPNCAFEKRAPTQYDVQYSLLDLWLDMSTTPDGDVWILTSLAGNSSGQLAHWVRLTNASGSGVLTVTGNSGGAVPPDGSGNLNLVGNTANGLTVAGNPGTNTLTINTTGNVPLAQSVTGNTGGAVNFDSSGNINVVGSTANGITVTGNPGTHTLTVTSTGGVPFGQSLTGDTGGTVNFNSSGNINIITDLAANNAGSTVAFIGNPGTHTLQLNVSTNNNTLIGDEAGNLTLTGDNNTALGVLALGDLTTGAFNTAVGSGVTLGLLTTGDLNTAIGYQCLDELLTGSNNTAIGVGSGNAYTGAESSNVLIRNNGVLGESNVMRLGTDGSGAGEQNVTYMAGDVHFPHNIVLDASTAAAATNPIINFSSSNNIISFFLNNVFIGQNAGNTTMTPGVALFNVGIGSLSSQNITTGDRNTGVGNGTHQELTTGTANTSYAHLAGNSLTTGVSNTFIGDSSAEDLVTGSHNTFLGAATGTNYTGAESSNILIGSQQLGVLGESNILRIGVGTGSGTGDLSKAFIAGIRGITTDINDAVAVLIDSAGQLGTVSSSIRYKENIKDFANESDALFKLRPVTFNNKKDESKTKRYGLIAEEVAEVMPHLVVYDKDGNCETVKYHELPIFLLNELQKQRKTIDALSLVVRHLENQLQTCTCK